MRNFFLLVFLTTSIGVFSQELVVKKFNVESEIAENSGLIFFDNSLVTHNDSGGSPILYFLDATTGVIKKRVKITNAYNIDWEDIAQDDSHIFISDSGNNKGSRSNLKIYKVAKTDILKSDYVTAETIFYSYEDQKKFKSSSKNNFDAEALISFGEHLYIFSKNRGNHKSKIYQLSKTPGNQVAKRINTIEIEGQITGATISNQNELLLCGYTSSLSPFLVFIDEFNPLSKNFTRIDLSQFMGLPNQVEGITFVDSGTFAISRERFKKKIAGFSLNTPASLFEINIQELKDYISTTKTKNSEITRVINQKGKAILKKKDTITQAKLDKLPAGNYFVKYKFSDELIINKELLVD